MDRARINPPFVPYAPALARAGIDIGKVLLVYPKSHREALWALEQALKSGASSAALTWLDESALKTTEIRRLQLAAVTGSTWTTLFVPPRSPTSRRWRSFASWSRANRRGDEVGAGEARQARDIDVHLAALVDAGDVPGSMPE